MRRNRELEKIIRMLQKEQEENGVKAMRLAMKFLEVERVNRKRK